MNMDYRCSRCGRTFFYGEIVSFCPFCGQAYNVFSAGDSTLSVVQNEGNIRISIGSDSEKTIQEKYWKLTLGSLNSAMYLLRYGLPRFSPEREARDDQYVKTPEEYETARLDIYKFMALKNSTSFAMFRKNLEGYLSDMQGVCKKRKNVLDIASENFKAYQKEMVAKRLSYELGEWSVEDLEDEYSVRIEEEEEFIRNFCTDIAEALGNMSPDRLVVELDYDPDEMDWQREMGSVEQEKLPSLTEAHIELLELIHEVSHAVVRAVQENGMFILSAMNRSVDEDFKPEAYVDQLRTLAEADYDPLFGDPPEEFIEYFSKAVVNMTAYLNGLPEYEDVVDYTPERLLDQMKCKLDEKKLDALSALVENWTDVLSQELDRLYQRQSENMVDVYNTIEQMKKTLEDDLED